jgi:hypothetical protein
MDHFTTPDFWNHYHVLPKEVRDLADKNYQILRLNPSHPSLHFKEVHAGLWSVRVGRSYRALCFREDDGYYWFWIGSHAEYDNLISR